MGEVCFAFIISLINVLCPVAYGKHGLNRALYGTSVTFGTLIKQLEAAVLRNGAISNLACGCRGNQFNLFYISSKRAIAQVANKDTGRSYPPLERAQQSLSYGILI